MALSQYLMQAKSSADGQLYTWTATAPDWAAAGYTGTGSALDVAVAGGGADQPDVANAVTASGVQVTAGGIVVVAG